MKRLNLACSIITALLITSYGLTSYAGANMPPEKMSAKQKQAHSEIRKTIEQYMLDTGDISQQEIDDRRTERKQTKQEVGHQVGEREAEGDSGSSNARKGTKSKMGCSTRGAFVCGGNTEQNGAGCSTGCQMERKM